MGPIPIALCEPPPVGGSGAVCARSVSSIQLILSRKLKKAYLKSEVSVVRQLLTLLLTPLDCH